MLKAVNLRKQQCLDTSGSVRYVLHQGSAIVAMACFVRLNRLRSESRSRNCCILTTHHDQAGRPHEVHTICSRNRLKSRKRFRAISNGYSSTGNLSWVRKSGSWKKNSPFIAGFNMPLRSSKRRPAHGLDEPCGTGTRSLRPPFRYRGGVDRENPGRPVAVDIDPFTFNIDPNNWRRRSRRCPGCVLSLPGDGSACRSRRREFLPSIFRPARRLRCHRRRCRRHRLS